MLQVTAYNIQKGLQPSGSTNPQNPEQVDLISPAVDRGVIFCGRFSS